MMKLLLVATISVIVTGTITTGCPVPTPRDCGEAYRRGCREDGVYTIDPGCGSPFGVFCDMKNGGWTVFQRRRDGSENFYRGWADYVAGFGNLKREFWLGLDRINCLTSVIPRTELRVDLADFEGYYQYAQYSSFSVGNSRTNYRLHIAGYTGTAGDSFGSHNGYQFTTKDRDNDRWTPIGKNCAVSHQGAWWYAACLHSQLNGLYRSGQHGEQYIVWRTFHHDSQNNPKSLKFAQMKLRLHY